MECEPKIENVGSPDREGGAEGTEGMADCDGLKGGAEETEDSKKRKRKPYRPGQLLMIFIRSFCSIHTFNFDMQITIVTMFKSRNLIFLPGIGGFMVRQRKCHTRQKKEFFAQLAGVTTLDGQPIERTIDEGNLTRVCQS